MPKRQFPVLYKAVFQVRYRSKLEYLHQALTAAQHLTDYSDWETDGVRVTLRDPDKRCSTAIAPDSCSYEQDSGDLSLEQEGIRALLDVVPHSMGIDSATRFGYRQWFILDADMSFESLVSVLSVKLLSSDEGLRQVMPQTISDLMYRIDAADNGHKYHITIGPVRREEVQRWLPFNRKHHLRPETAAEDLKKILDSYPSVGVLIDADMYQEAQALPIAEALPFAEQCREKLSRMTKSVGDYLFRADMEGR